jgi:hypothetical protein
LDAVLDAKSGRCGMTTVPVHFALAGKNTAEADALIMRWHYSHRVPKNIQAVGMWRLDGGLFGDTGPAVAACYFSIPPTRWGEPVLELSRLVRAEGVALPPLSGLIAETVRWVKRKRLADLVVSFADATHSHHGGVYQAASWQYDGQRAASMDGVIYGGQLVPGRSANSIWGTRSPAKLAERGIIVAPHYDEGKYLYWRAVNRAGSQQAKRLGLRAMAYPKPQMMGGAT